MLTKLFKNNQEGVILAKLQKISKKIVLSQIFPKDFINTARIPFPHHTPFAAFNEILFKKQQL